MSPLRRSILPVPCLVFGAWMAGIGALLPDTLRADEPFVVVAFGDSVTAPRGRTEVYPGLLAAEMSHGGKDIKVVNAGVGGNTTALAKARFEKDVLDASPDLVILMFGINDAAVDVWKDPPATRPRVPLESYRRNLTDMVSELKTREVEVVLMTPNPLYWTNTTRELYAKAPYLPEEPDGFNVILRDYAQAVRKVAAEQEVGLVDVFNAFEDELDRSGTEPTSVVRDGMHPGDPGQRIIADLLIDHLGSAVPDLSRKPFTVWQPSGTAVTMHPRATDITHDTPHDAVLGPAMMKLDDGSVLSVYSTPTSYGGKNCYIAGRVTRDGGANWEPERELARLPEGSPAHPTCLRTRSGALHLFFLGYVRFGWNEENPTDDTQSDLWTSRSDDDGKSWSAPERIFEGYTGSTNGAVETESGAIVVPFSHYVKDPGRLVSRTAVLATDGSGWRLGNEIDIGGAGDHDGALEPCVYERRDGRLRMLIRTTRGILWDSHSTDDGLSWSPAQPTEIVSSSSPAHVVRLSDGDLAMVWNPFNRRQLHLAFSSDDGESWEPSTAIARGSATYPFAHEQQPGELWIGFIDPHQGWGSTPRARHLKIPVAPFR